MTSTTFSLHRSHSSLPLLSSMCDSRDISFRKIKEKGSLQSFRQYSLTVGGSVRINVRLVSSLTGLDLTNKKYMLLFVHTEITEFKPIKQETIRYTLKDQMTLKGHQLIHGPTSQTKKLSSPRP